MAVGRRTDGLEAPGAPRPTCIPLQGKHTTAVPACGAVHNVLEAPGALRPACAPPQGKQTHRPAGLRGGAWGHLDRCALRTPWVNPAPDSLIGSP